MNYDTTPLWAIGILAVIVLALMVWISIHSYLHPDRWASSPEEKERMFKNLDEEEF